MQKLPTLADLKKTIPPGGLLNPGLRRAEPMNPAKLKAQLFRKKLKR
jgi:hypothetical protein